MDWLEMLQRLHRYAAEMAAEGRPVLEEASEARRLAQEAANLMRRGRTLDAGVVGRAAERAFARFQARVTPPPTERYTEIERALAHSSVEGIIAEARARPARAAETPTRVQFREDIRAAEAANNQAIIDAAGRVWRKSPATNKASWYRRMFGG